MSQIAQQDHLYVEIEAYNSLTEAEQKILQDKYRNGTLLDVVIIEKGLGTMKVLSYTVDDLLYISCLEPDSAVGIVLEVPLPE